MTTNDLDHPELIFGLIGPVGCNIDHVQTALARTLRMFGYESQIVRVSQGISDLLEEKRLEDPEVKSELDTISDKINAGNEVRSLYKNNGILAAWSITEIQEKRKNRNLARMVQNADPKVIAAPQTAYIIRQLKRHEEMELLQRVYEKKFIAISIVDETHQREENLIQYLRRKNSNLHDQQAEIEAQRLMRKDEDEAENEHGQRLINIFHLADVFIDGRDNRAIEQSINRFVQALFGKTDIAPTKDEFGSYMARSASLRSVDLSRQVGAAILSESGDLITIGCNEVPKPGGGNYWDEDERKWRDIDHRNEANQDEKSRIVGSFLETLQDRGLLASGCTSERILSDPEHRRAVFESRVGEITEYGRMVHAEMNAIADAARLGRSVRGSTMYVTTFPCHNCMKHIIASGITRVIFIEPYPKSRALQLYRYALSLDGKTQGMVQLSPFSGIAPKRFFDIFEKRRRIDKDTGEIYEYDQNRAYPRVGLGTVDHIRNEIAAIKENFPIEREDSDTDVDQGVLS